MRVLQINNHHAMKGGSERVYIETGRLLERHGHEVFYFGASSDSSAERDEHHCILPADPLDQQGVVNKVARAARFIYSNRVARELNKFLDQAQPDIAHLHIFYGQLSNSVLDVLRERNIPSVMTVHEYRMLCPTYLMLDSDGNACHKCPDEGYHNAVFKRCNKGSALFSALAGLECKIRDVFFPYEKNIARFIMVSDFCRKMHIKYRPEVAEKSVKLFNFVDLKQFEVSSDIGDYFLYLGRVSREKGVATLLSAFKGSSHRLKIVGTGDLLSSFEKEYADASNVEFCGFKSGKDLEELIKKSRFLCIPSECYENNPMSVIESFAYGKPVIGADIGGIPELVIDRVTGRLFPSGDVNALKRVLDDCWGLDSDEYLRLSKNARAFAETNLSDVNYYEKLLGIYQDVLSGL